MALLETLQDSNIIDLNSLGEKRAAGKLAVSLSHHLPEPILTNEEIASWGLKTFNGKPFNAEAIYGKLGVMRRHIATSKNSTGEMAIKAAEKVIDEVGTKINAVFFSASYPEDLDPLEAVIKKFKLKPEYMSMCHAACSGFALVLAHIHLRREQFWKKRILVVTSDKQSDKVLDLRYETDPSFSQAMLGDGAAAFSFVLGEGFDILDFATDYKYSETIRMPIEYAFCNRYPTIIRYVPPSPDGKFRMDGAKVYEEAVDTVSKQIPRLLEKAKMPEKKVNLTITHQASLKVLRGIAKRLPNLTFARDLDDANLASTSIPVALGKAFRCNLLKTSDTAAISGFGAGFNSTSVILKF